MSWQGADGARIEDPTIMQRRRRRTLTRQQVRWYRNTLVAFLYHGVGLTNGEVVEVFGKGVSRRWVQKTIQAIGTPKGLPGLDRDAARALSAGPPEKARPKPKAKPRQAPPGRGVSLLGVRRPSRHG